MLGHAWDFRGSVTPLELKKRKTLGDLSNGGDMEFLGNFGNFELVNLSKANRFFLTSHVYHIFQLNIMMK